MENEGRAYIRLQGESGFRGTDSNPHDALFEHVARLLDEGAELYALGLELLHALLVFRAANLVIDMRSNVFNELNCGFQGLVIGVGLKHERIRDTSDTTHSYLRVLG